MALRHALLFATVAAGPMSCTGSSDQGPPSEESRSDGPGDEAAPCKTDADCLACSTERDCGCEPRGKAQGCREALHSCFADPCQSREAVCAASRCVLGPASTIGQSETALDAEVPISLRWNCKMYGTAISSRTIEVTHPPVSVRFDTQSEKGTPRSVPDEELNPLRQLLGSDDFRALLAETPKEGPPSPGMTDCTLDLSAGEIEVEGKQWKSSDQLEPASTKAQLALEAELERLGGLAREPSP